MSGEGQIIPYKEEIKKEKKKHKKPIPTHLQIHTKHLKTKLGEYIWYIKRIEKDLRAANKLHKKGSVLREHARAIRPNNV